MTKDEDDSESTNELDKFLEDDSDMSEDDSCAEELKAYTGDEVVSSAQPSTKTASNTQVAHATKLLFKFIPTQSLLKGDSCSVAGKTFSRYTFTGMTL